MLAFQQMPCHLFIYFLELNINILDALSLTKLRANSEKANGSTTRVKIGQQLPRINKNEQTKTKACSHNWWLHADCIEFFHIV